MPSPRAPPDIVTQSPDTEQTQAISVPASFAMTKTGASPTWARSAAPRSRFSYQSGDPMRGTENSRRVNPVGVVGALEIPGRDRVGKIPRHGLARHRAALRRLRVLHELGAGDGPEVEVLGDLLRGAQGAASRSSPQMAAYPAASTA